MKEKRLYDIVEKVNQAGMISFKELGDQFNVSSVTLRKDLIELENRGLLKRMHGGVKSLSQSAVVELPYSIRTAINVEEKRRIAQYAYTLIKPEDVVILDASSTVRELAALLSASTMPLTVFTNDVEIARMLTDSRYIELTIVGGHIRQGHYGAVGLFSMALWRQIRADKLFLGVDSVQPEMGFFNHNTDEIECKRLMIECAREHYVLCDHTKFSARPIVQLCPLSDADQVVTGKELGEDIFESYGEYRKKIILT